MKLLATALALLLLASVGISQITSFPYTYNWTNPQGFNPKTGASGGDGRWATTIYSGKTEFATVKSSGWVNSNITNHDCHLWVNVDLTGKTLTGGEVFTFSAKRTSGARGQLFILAGSTTLLTVNLAFGTADITTSWKTFSATLPTSLSRTSFALQFVVSPGAGNLSIDNTSIHGGALPITLSSFKIGLSADGPVLTWSTMSEISNYGFYVQKSQDNDNWADIPGSFQEGFGTTVEAHSYSFADHTLPPGKYYRLRQVDLDGAEHYSNTLSLATSVEESTPIVKEFALQQNYPNPFNPTTTLRYSVGGVVAPSGAFSSGVEGPALSHVKLIVYDVLGKQVATLVDEVKAPGVYQVSFDGGKLASGVYIYRLTSGNYTSMKKMVLLR